VLPPAGAGDECLAIPESLQSPAMRSSIHMAIQQNPSSGRLQMSLRPSTGPRPGTASSSVSLSSRGLGFPTRPYTAGTRKASFSRNQRLGTHKSSHIPSSHIPNVHLAPQCNSSPFVTNHWWGFSGEDKARLNGNSAKREGAKKMHLFGPERRVVLALWKGKNLKIHVKFHFNDTFRIPVSRAHERDLECVLMCFSKMPCPTNIPPLPLQSVSCSEQFMVLFLAIEI